VARAGWARVRGEKKERVGEGARAAGELARGEAGARAVVVCGSGDWGRGGEGGFLYAAVARVRRSGRLALDFSARSHFFAVIIIHK
jgi:hypothetical protein